MHYYAPRSFPTWSQWGQNRGDREPPLLLLVVMWLICGSRRQRPSSGHLNDVTSRVWVVEPPGLPMGPCWHFLCWLAGQRLTFSSGFCWGLPSLISFILLSVWIERTIRWALTIPVRDILQSSSWQFSGIGLISKVTHSVILKRGLGFTSISSLIGESSVKQAKQFPVSQMWFPWQPCNMKN